MLFMHYIEYASVAVIVGYVTLNCQRVVHLCLIFPLVMDVKPRCPNA